VVNDEEDNVDDGGSKEKDDGDELIKVEILVN